MNILFYCAEYPPCKTGGIGSVTKIFAEELVRRGHNVYVVGYYAKYKGFRRYTKINGVHIYRLNLYDTYLAGIYFILKCLNKLHISSLVYNLRVKYTESFIKSFVFDKKIDILELTDYYPFNINLRNNNYYKFKVPTILRIHGSLSFLYDQRGEVVPSFIECNDKMHFLRCDYISAVSKYSLNWVKNKFPNINFQDEIVIYNPIEDKFLNKNDIDIDTKTILFLGKISKTKGTYSLLKAFNICASKDKDVRLRLIGGGDIEYAKTLVKSEFKNRVDFLGYCDREKIKQEIDNCSFACIPSYFETFGLVALEIMARNKALIFTARAAGPEIISDGIDGLLVDPEDINQIADKILLLLNDNEYRVQIAQKGYEKIKEKFLVSKVVSQLEDFYNTVKK